MPHLDDLRLLFKRFFHKSESEGREMKRVFQWRRYFEWRDLTLEERLSAKRFLFIPVFAYIIIWIFNQNFSLIIIFLTGYILYKKFEKGGFIKK